MTERRTSRSTDTLRRHLLTGASVAVIALASAAVVAPTGALAQVGEIETTSATASPTNLSGDGTTAITNATDTDAQFGAIDTNGGDNNFASITLDGNNGVTLFVHDSDRTDTNLETSTVSGSFVVANTLDGDNGGNDIATVTFGASDGGTTPTTTGAAVLTVEGNLAGSADAQTAGGDLLVDVTPGLAENDSALNVNGSTNLRRLFVEGGEGLAAANGGTITATFGDDATADNFTLGFSSGSDDALNVSGGEASNNGSGVANDSGNGANAVVEINANTLSIAAAATTVSGGDGVTGADGVTAGTAGDGQLTINVGSGGGTFAAINVTGGDGGTGAATAGADGVGGNGGTSTFQLSGGSSTATSLTIQGGQGGDGGADDGATSPEVGRQGGDGGRASGTLGVDTILTLGTGTGTVLTVADGAAGTPGNPGTTGGAGTGGAVGDRGDAQLLVNGTLNVAGDAALTDDSAAGTLADDATIVVGSIGRLTFAGDVTGNGAQDTLFVNSGGTVTFTEANTSGQAVNGVAIDGGGTLEFSGADKIVTFNTDSDIGGGAELAAFVFTDSADAVFQGTVDVHDITLGAGSNADFENTANISGNVSGTGTVEIGDADLIFDGGDSTQTVETAIIFSTDGQGVVDTRNEAGITFEGQIGTNPAGPGAAAQDIRIGEENNVTFNGQVWTDLFTMEGDTSTDGGTTNLTFNATTNVQVSIQDDDGGATELTLANSDILLGANISTTDDVVFQSNGTGADLSFTDPDDDIVVNLSSNFTSDHITFLDDDGDQTIATGNDITENDTALTEFSVVYLDGAATVVADPTTNNFQDIRITAERRSNAAIADALNITDEQGAALASAVDAAAAAFAASQSDANEELVDAFTQVLNDTNGAANLFSASAASAAQSVILPEDTLAAASDVAFEIAGQQGSMIGDRLAGVRSHDARFATTFGGFSGGDLIVTRPPTVHAAPAPQSTASAWARPFGGFANADDDGNRAGYDAAFGGVALGIDGSFDDVTIGAFGSYTYADVDGDGVGNSELEASTFMIGAYAAYTGATFYVDAFASYGASDNDTSRTVTVGNVTERVTGNFDADQFAIGASGGVPIAMGPNTYITPQASLTWYTYDADDYTEDGGTLALDVDQDSVNQLTGTVAARIHGVYDNVDADGTVFIPELRLGVVFDLVDDDATATTAFTGGGAAFEVTGTDTDDVGALVGVGFALDNPGWSAALAYDGDIRGDYMSHVGRAELRLKF